MSSLPSHLQKNHPKAHFPPFHLILTMLITKTPTLFHLLQVVILVLLSNEDLEVSSFGSMSSIAVSYGENGPSFCSLNTVDGSRSVRCQGADSAVVYATPASLPFLGLTAGDGFVCGLLMHQHQPYCWGNNIYIQMGVPQPMKPGAIYIDISAGDHHLCALRRPTSRNSSIVDCWGYNMTNSYGFGDEIMSITGGSGFNCGLLVRNGTAVCWGDESDSGVSSLIPRNASFHGVSAGGFHVCGVLADGGSRVFCWGRSLSLEGSHGGSSGGNVDLVPDFPFLSVVGGRFHACGIKAYDHGVVCWGFRLEQSTPVPDNMSAFAIAAGDYFTCGVPTASSMNPICWGENFPTGLPLAVSPVRSSGDDGKRRKWSSLRTPIFLAELAIAVFLVSAVALAAILYVRFKLQKASGAAESKRGKSSVSSSFRKNIVKVKPDLEELKIRRAQQFGYEELEKATDGFSDESQVGRGSFSCVFKGVLKDGTVVAVKRAIMASDLKKNSKEFHTELDLLSRLNHAHLLNLLGYCEEGGERLLVYEFMAHGSLHELLHGKKKGKEPLDWIRRVTIAVQAARGIEYLHGYACPPVIHRDIKSSNILIDEEWNARVADFGLSLLGPTDSSSALSELPAGTLGYLDPEYYRLHYLTTKSDVYSFGVLLLEILSGRKAIDMQFEEGNIVEWAVPLIKDGNLEAILDASLKQPVESEALRKIANVACKCVRMRGKERPSMDKVTTALERALAVLMGSPSNEQPILPSEVVLGSSRLHKKASQRSSNRSASEIDMGEGDDQRTEFRAPSWITFPSLASSQRRKSSASEADIEGKNPGGNDHMKIVVTGDGLMSLEEEIGPASPQQEIFLRHNF
ncbi:serine/threonine-protein kinase-like protein CR4 [Nymphaea colorata]|nr:serine/threonine-protein kinase-like protein CR4 [Nymphaea colorata]